MKTIYKYELSPNGLDDLSGILMPEGANILCVQTQYNSPFLWAEVENENTPEYRHFFIVGTGHDLPPDNKKYIGTFQLDDGRLVFHVYEKL